MNELGDMVAIVTGSGRARGIGRGIALELARQGAIVAVTDIGRPRPDLNMAGQSTVAENATELEAVAAEIESLGTNALAVTADITSSDEIDACVERVADHFGGIDILVNNAGTLLGAGPFMDLDDHAWEMSWLINVMGAVRFSRCVVPHMRERGGGAIVNTASVSGLKVSQSLSAYCATKFALVGLTKCLALDLGPSGIRCNAVCPGDIDTQMGDTAKELLDLPGANLEEVLQQSLEQIGLRRRGTPSDVARVVAWLAGPQAQYVNGAAVTVDGGLSEVLV